MRVRAETEERAWRREMVLERMRTKATMRQATARSRIFAPDVPAMNIQCRGMQRDSERCTGAARAARAARAASCQVSGVRS